MKKYSLFIYTFFCLLLVSCSSNEDNLDTTDAEMDQNSGGTTEEESGENPDAPTREITQRTDVKTFIFGHSLIVHTPPLIPTPSDETTVPHWMHALSQSAGHSYAVDGQYGFLPQHDNLPPTAQWGFDIASGVWNSEVEPFSEADFNTILLTAANFIQYQPANIPYDGENPENVTPIQATNTIIDWVTEQEEGITVYIYENWPDMAGFMNSFPPTEEAFAAYNTNILGDFHNWWLDYHDAIRIDQPNVKMIPVGPIISKLLTDTALEQIPILDLYEDDAPHGRPTIYFLAGLITYSAMYGTQPPSDFEIPETVHSIVRDNYQETLDFIWNELQNFNDESGNSRVW
ncbi:T9SS C-terminal target domain-containing protein [Aquimarina algicola]|uniref:T9SS C-terminal target domain-containing protein n=1 Tax=Aquimarina algicola TaxID=2589995 RepID=A0A504J7R3_9FLAO|nr:T9SS C-terminal target domain-containing protein [Aquimarina algicola]TPN86896.1 T9SS C-terminal target domain-containing protein [Aquimarina algicola]